MEHEHHYAKLKPCSLGFGLGLTWAIAVLLTGWISWLMSGGGLSAVVELWGRVYVGFAPSFWGAVVGAIWAFVHAFIGGWLIAWFYNKCVCCKKACASSCASSCSSEEDKCASKAKRKA